MAENLKTTHYNNGDPILTTDPVDKYIGSEVNPKYQWPCDGVESNVAIYGRLYTWYAITDARSVCPTGWHVSTLQDWQLLEAALGGLSYLGNKLKETGTDHWAPPNSGSTNISGFTALPGGLRAPIGGVDAFYDLHYICHLFNSNEVSGYASQVELRSNDPNLHLESVDKNFGHAVRCVMDH
jgi:uncharacterized protein (TIGR02145 family)